PTASAAVPCRAGSARPGPDRRRPGRRGRSMRTAPRIGSGLVGWRRLAVVAALADAVVLFGYGLARGDREALGFAVVMLVGLGLLRVGQGLLGVGGWGAGLLKI